MSVRLSRRLVLFVALAVVVALTVPATARSSTPLLRHGHVDGKRIGRVAEFSTNWAGWDNTGSTYTKITASWVQPAVTCSSRKASYSSFWIGLDGDGSNSVEQTGSEADCSHGRPVYYSWYEFYPAFPSNYSNTVKPGDHFSASVTSTGGGNYTLVLTDSTQGWSQTKNGTASGASNASAEAIAEAPSSSGSVLQLANFGTVAFSNVLVNGSNIGSVPTANQLTMVTSGGVTKASPSALSGGNAFTVTWHHS